MADIQKSSEFLETFHKGRDGISVALNSLESKPSSSLAKETQSVGSALAHLSSTLSGASLYLAPYDQRRCDLDLKNLQEGLEKWKKLVPKSRFSFKKKAATEVTDVGPAAITATPSPSNSPNPAPNHETQEIPVLSTRDKTSNALIDGNKNCYISSRSLSLSTTPSDITISNLDRCIVDLLPSKGSPLNAKATALYIRGLRHTVILAGMVEGSVRIEDCQGCIFVLGGWQFRVERCISCHVYCYVSSVPVIEESKDMQFAAYPRDQLQAPVELFKPSQHHAVKDFSWIRATPSPNWKILSEEDQIDWDAWTTRSKVLPLETTNAETTVFEQELQRLLSTIIVRG